MLSKIKIRPKFTLVLLIFSSVPLLISSFAHFYNSSHEIQQMMVRGLQITNISRANNIHHLIQLRQEHARTLAGMLAFKGLQPTAENNEQIIETIQNNVDSIYNDLKKLPTSDYSYIDRSTEIEIIAVWNANGYVVSSTDEGLIGMRLPPSYLQNVKEKGSYFGDFQLNPSTGEEYMLIIEEIRDAEDKDFIGAVLFLIKARILNEITTARAGLGDTGETYIVDNKYNMLTNSRFVKENGLKIKVNTDVTRACFSSEDEAIIYDNYLGEEVLGIHQYLGDLNWCLVSEVRVKEILEPISRLGEQIMIVTAFFILAIWVFAYFATRIFIQPIVNLSEASKHLAQGDHGVKVDFESEDELGELTKAFNDMSKQLSDAMRELESKNQVLGKNLKIKEQQRRDLEKANKELDRFVHIVSHDIRAPLFGITGYSTFLEKCIWDKLNDKEKRSLKGIIKGTQRLSQLVENLLTLTKISRIQNPFDTVDIKELISSIKDRLEYSIKENNVELVVNENLPAVVCDRIKIEEAFFNLINNAIKFSTKGNGDRPRIEIGYYERGTEHVLYVKDNGIGIDRKYQTEIFNLFERLHDQAEYGGTGVGLNIVKCVVDDHKGRIWIESKLGQGATFFFTIPKDLS